MAIRDAMEGLGLQAEADLQWFDEADPFNPHNEVAGWLCRRSDHRYGALVIETVNGIAARQTIYATPKLAYPFGRTELGERVYSWPTDVVRVEAHEKLDGTNICTFAYADGSGAPWVSHKTRLTPFVRDGKFGSFHAMWCEVLESRPELRLPFPVVTRTNTHSTEMYGHRNGHTIAYETPLAARGLFSVRQSDAGVRPSPEGVVVAVCESAADLPAFYEKLRLRAESENSKIDEETISGTEGYVLYVQDSEAEWSMLKCKPESIEAIHWASDFIPYGVVLNTARNARESCDGDLTVEYVRDMLREEFTIQQCLLSHPRTVRAVREVTQAAEWRAEVLAAYLDTGLTFDADGKGPVMRSLAVRFDRSQMKSVYSSLAEQGLAP